MVRVGIDLVEVERLEGFLARRGNRALARLFTPGEVAYAMRARPPLRYQRLAARFAAKEAFIKALGRPVPFRELEVIPGAEGPCLRWQGRDFPLSLTHTRKFACAVVVIPEPPTPP
jgi:holo-[acyl-carrier protein] synthase